MVATVATCVEMTRDECSIRRQTCVWVVIGVPFLARQLAGMVEGLRLKA